MALKHTQKLFEEFGESDPLFAVLSEKSQRGNRWDPEAFFALGREDIREAMEYLASLDIELHRNTAMDFGCGVGRLTQALCDEFDHVTGVDISHSMIKTANEFNRFGERCTYLVNTRDDLGLLDEGTCDFIYTDKVLQHMHPQYSSRYIAEFFRVLKPGGVALFQIPSGKPVKPGSLAEKWYNLRKGPLRRFWKRLRGKQPVEMHHLHHARVKEIIRASGGKLVEARQHGSVRRHRVSYFYCARRAG